MPYVKTVWIDDQAPAIDSINLNHIENGIANNDLAIADIISGATTVAKATTATTADNLVVPVVTSPIGAVIMWPSTTIPTHYMECNGATLPRTHALFTLIGTTFGIGDGVTTFNIPDLRGYFVRGWDHGRGIDSGRILGSNQDDELKSHTHVTHLPMGAADGSVNAPKDSSGIAKYLDVTSNSTGGVETRPKNTALIYLIKVS